MYIWLCMISPPLVSNLWHPSFTKSTKVQPSQVAVGKSEASDIFWTKRSVPPSSPLGPWPHAPIRFLQKKWWRTVRACHGFWWNHGHKHSASIWNVEKSHLCQRIGPSWPASFPLRQPLEYLSVSALSEPTQRLQEKLHTMNPSMHESFILLMVQKSGNHQLRLVVYPII